MRIENERKLDFDDVLIKPKRSRLSTRAGVELNRKFTTVNSKVTIEGVPIIAANMDTVGTLNMASSLASHNMFTSIHKHYSLEELEAADLSSDYNFATFGLGDWDRMVEFFDKLKDKNINKICLDVANGYTEVFVDFVKQVRAKYPDKIIMAGNVVTPEMTEALILAGADIVKIGIGPGSVCETRIVTGVGYPQVSAVMECADAAHGIGGLICADGGCKTSGDVAKAFAAGADFVMLGGMLAGHKECLSNDDLDKLDGNNNKIEYYGMSSTRAMNKYSGGVAAHRASEGKVSEIEYRGDVNQTVLAILGGIRSACTYVGAAKLKELSKCTTFVIKN